MLIMTPIPPINPQTFRMRRWRGMISDWTVELTALSYEDNSDINRLLNSVTETELESLASTLFHDSVLHNLSYVWLSSGSDMHDLTNRLSASNAPGPNFLRTHNLHIVSVFLFNTTGPIGFSVNPSRYVFILKIISYIIPYLSIISNSGLGDSKSSSIVLRHEINANKNKAV